MPKLRKPRAGERMQVSGLPVPFSFWPAKKTTRWKQQRRLYVRDPWPILNEAVYRAKKLPAGARDEALAYIEQAEEYFNAATVGDKRAVKPVLLYYSMLNLAKCIIKIRKPGLDLSKIMHGLSADHSAQWAFLTDAIDVKTSSKLVNAFAELISELEGKSVRQKTIYVKDIIPQILPGHRLWTYASGKDEEFLAVYVNAYVNRDRKRGWLRLRFNRGELQAVSKTVEQLIKGAHLPGKWRQVKSRRKSRIILEQVRAEKYDHSPIDCAETLFQKLKPALWCTVTAYKPHRKYYLFVNSRPNRLPQWASVYILFYYLSDLTRYRPKLFDRLIAGKYGPLIENALGECPRQFLYLMASELLRREVAPAGIVV
jgi:hypothetical protein